MPVSFAFPFGGAEKKNSKDEESNDPDELLGVLLRAENRRGEQQQETVGLAFGKSGSVTVRFSALFLSLL